MKKLLSVLLVLVMLLSLCACGKKDAATTDPTDLTAATDGTTTTGSTESTDATTGSTTPSEGASEPTTAATQPNTSATQSTSPATQTTTTPAATTPAATTCSHSWSNATCKTPKKCSKCGATEGSTGDHNFVDNVCTVCNAEAPFFTFLNGMWTAYIVRSAEYAQDIPNAGDVLSMYTINPEKGEEWYAYKDYYSNPDRGEVPPFDSITYNGKTYYDYWFSSNMGGFDELKEEANGNIRVDFMNDDNIVLKMESATKFVVVSSADTKSIPVGTVFVKD